VSIWRRLVRRNRGEEDRFMLENETATQLEPGPDTTLRSTLPTAEVLARALASGSHLGASRRSSVLASLSGVNGPLPERYSEEGVLGKGGMGVVVLALDRDLGRPVAVKKLNTGKGEPETLDRFLREAQVTAQLEHPGILPVYDLGADETGRFYYVMRLVRGDRTVRRVIDQLKAGDAATHAEFSFERRVKLIQQVAQILSFAHAKGVIHRDVKPENIMLGSYGEVYLVDWGLAKVTGAAEAPAIAAPLGAPSETAAGSLVGTPRYMSPEQADGKPATPLSDVYSLSAVLYELLSLEHYMGKEKSGSIEGLLHRVMEEEPVLAEVHVGEKNGRVPRPLSRMANIGLAKNPQNRFPSARALEQALERWLEGELPVVCAVTLQLKMMSVWKRFLDRHPAAAILLAFVLPLALLAAVVGLAIVVAMGH
jgi:serine/threonine-protein kinase